MINDDTALPMVSCDDIIFDVERFHIRYSKGDVLQHASSAGSLINISAGYEVSGYIVYQDQLIVIV